MKSFLIAARLPSTAPRVVNCMLSVVIPVYNEAESLPRLYDELAVVARNERYELEIVLVDDGSSDGSWTCIRSLATRDPRVRGIKFRRNFGKAAALRAGFQAACGDVVMTLDADLQDDPREIPRFRRGAGGRRHQHARRDQRLEAGAARSLAQGASLASLQLDGQPLDRRRAARP